jgi:hypothetical protein
MTQPGERWHKEKCYLREMAAYSAFPISLDDEPLGALRPLANHSDLYLRRPREIAASEPAFMARTAAMLERSRGSFLLLEDQRPLVAVRELAEDSVPMLVRLSSRRGSVGLRFLVRGVLTEPLPVRTRCGAWGEVVIKDDALKTDFSGLRVLESEVPRRLLNLAGKRADEGWATVELAFKEGEIRFAQPGQSFLRSDVGRVMSIFVGLALWLGLLVPLLVQAWCALEPPAVKVLLSPALLAVLFGPPLWRLLSTLKNLGRYRAGEDPFVWIFHRWHELSR